MFYIKRREFIRCSAARRPRGRWSCELSFLPAGNVEPVGSVTMLTLIRTHPVKPWISWQLGAVAIFATSAAHANDELIRMSQNPKNWVMPTGNYANHRYSQLKTDHRR